ncbi:hypothetical protein CVT24_010355 [Panaeolus cyanescens]|uniref:Zn(2)-C6 fungal-type domain-containing protein n=1 Tax=Panaeolus cyanescens TaxID=181874 RepID=A0A409VAI5_9AGAR|nr:hypothetical protein CVT24_010355 [Panaeolus cyanescens]
MPADTAKKASGSGNPRGRGSYNPACDVCARKKTKCDGIKPICNPCRSQGRELECAWTKNPARKPRSEAHFEALQKYAENTRKCAEEFRKYADYLESLVDQLHKENPARAFDFRSSRPSDIDGIFNGSGVNDDYDHDFDLAHMNIATMDIEDHEHHDPDPTKEIRIPTQSFKIEEGGTFQHYGPTAVFRPFNYQSEPPPEARYRLPLPEDPNATYVLLVEGVDESNYNPDFDWSRHLPSAVPLDRRSHDKALDLLFKFFTSWCLRIIPQLFLRDMYRALSVPRSHPPPKTPHYSPMLHNALVALALAFLDEPQFRDLKSRQYFANAAKSYIETDCQKPNLSVVNALSILASFHSSQGDQTLGYLYFGMSARMSQALGLNVDCSDWVKIGIISEPDRLDRLWASWMTFSQDVCWSLYVGREFCVSAPTDSDSNKEGSAPFVDNDFDQIPWVHHTSGIAPQPSYLTKTFDATCKLLTIARRIMDVVNSLNKARSRPIVLDELISDIDLKLNTWKGSLPPELEITVKSRPTATPHKLMLHLAYWWLFILLHRPFFYRKAKTIYTADSEIDHVKLCKRAADNIMELLSTWRSLYSLRYCPITLIQTVFSAGTVYVLSAMQASSGVRIAKKELHQALQQQKLVEQYLFEIGKSWQCATNIAGIFQNLLKEQMPIIERKAANVITSPGHDSLSVPLEQDEEDEPVVIPEKASALTRSLLSRRRSSGKIKQPQGHLVSHSRSTSVSAIQPPGIPIASTSSQPQPAVSSSPQITISPVQEISRSSSSTSAIMIPRSTRSSSSFSSSPSSFQDPWNLRTGSTHAASPVSHSPLSPSPLSPSPSDATSFVDQYTQANSFFNVSDYLPSFGSLPAGGDATTSMSFDIQQTDPFLFGNDQLGIPGFVNIQRPQPTNTHSPASGRELHGIPGMLGGHSLSQVPFQFILAADDPTNLHMRAHGSRQQATRASGSGQHSLLANPYPSFVNRSYNSSQPMNEVMQTSDNADNGYDDPFMGFEMLTN